MYLATIIIITYKLKLNSYNGKNLYSMLLSYPFSLHMPAYHGYCRNVPQYGNEMMVTQKETYQHLLRNV
jgi:hypothetical protein